MNVGSITTNNPIGYEYRKTQKAVPAQTVAGNVTKERMVDISKVDPNSSDYLDMFAYSSHMRCSSNMIWAIWQATPSISSSGTF